LSRARRVLRKTLEVLRAEGLGGIGKRVLHRTPKAPIDDFDAVHGVETCTPVNLWDLEISTDDWLGGVGYKPISAEVFENVLAYLPIKPAEYTFIDLGAGKGRALILAAEKGFRRVIGVEFSAELCVIARCNITATSGTAEVVCQSAREFSFPEEPAVVFLYNPFSPEILNDVLKHVHAESYLAYVNPRHAQVVDSFHFDPVYSASGLAIWHCKPGPRADENRQAD
jgi:SAM-dependent methyltransferase